MIEVFKGVEQRQIPVQIIQAPGRLTNADFWVGKETGESFLAVCYQLPLNSQHPILASYSETQNMPYASFLLQFGVLPADKYPFVLMQVGTHKEVISLSKLGIDTFPPHNYSIHFDTDPRRQLVTMEIPEHKADSHLFPLQTLFL